MILQNIIAGRFPSKVIPSSEIIDVVMDYRDIEIDEGQDTIAGPMKADGNNGEELVYKTTAPKPVIGVFYLDNREPPYSS